MRKKIVAANWKMNLTLDEGHKLVEEILKGNAALNKTKFVVVAPPFTHIAQTATQLKNKASYFTGAQNCSSEASGAYTGETSAAMLQSAGAAYVILGHSERREYFKEDDATIAKKINQALSAGLKVIFCCGEPLEIRDAEKQNDYVTAQLKSGLFHLSELQLKDIVIAYEPIWAIGTGRTANTQQAQDMHAHIRSMLTLQYGNDAANNISILYGGSCKAANAHELFSCADVDGGLIGGASLKAEEFLGIVDAMIKQ